jgi:AraC-like DNA-binding protein
MPGSGTRTLLEPDHYEASLRQALIEAVVTPCGGFRARLTWAELHDLQLLSCKEDFPHVAYLVMAPRLVFAAFAAGPNSLPLWDGTELHVGDIILHRRGQSVHHATRGPSHWSTIAVDPARLENYGHVLSGKPFSLPEGQVLRPSPRAAARLRRLHAQACRLAETNARMLAHPQVARAIEQDLIQTLVSCLTEAKVQEERAAKRHQAAIMIRLEEALSEYISQQLHTPELSELTGVTERALRSCCAEFLGITPSRYVLLRRLKLVRIALRDADPDTVNIREVAGRHGFAQLDRFTRMYEAAFGETPSTTLRQGSDPRFPSF